MKTLSAAEIKKLLKNLSLDKAAKLARDKRVYNLRPAEDGWSACVLTDSAMPAMAWLRDEGQRLHWNCDCGSGEACLHVWALAARLHQDDQLYNGQLRAALTGLAKPVSERKAAIARGQGAAIDLFDEGLWQPSLFDDGPAPAPPRPRKAADAGPGNPAGAPAASASPRRQAEADSLFAPDSVAPLPADASAAVLPESPVRLGLAAVRPAAAPEPEEPPLPDYSRDKPQLVVFLLRLQAMNRPDLWVEKLNLHLTPSQAAAMQAATLYQDSVRGLEKAVAHLARRVEDSPEHQLSLGSAIAEITAINQALAACPPLPIPRLSFTTPNRPLRLQAFDRLEVKPVLARTTPEGKGRYQLHFELFSGGESRSVVPAAQLASEGGLCYTVPKGDDCLLFRSGDPALAALAARVRAMDGPVGALDLELLRGWIAQRGVAAASLPEIGSERFAYREVAPRAVVSLQSGLRRTELFLSFAYDGKEVAFHSELENLTRDLPDGLTIVMKRQRQREGALHHRLRELMERATQYERGLYAEMIGARTVPDISVVAELPEFLAEYGHLLIQNGYDLRFEGKPVKTAGSLSFRAESGLDWFGFRAGWKDAAALERGEGDGAIALDGRAENVDAFDLAGSGGGRRDLVVDEHLDRYGMAGAKKAQGSVDSWILLGQRDIDRLKLLRNLGMDGNGLLETSPVNVSLIDSLYADIENKDEEHVRRSRELSQTLGDFTARQQAQSHSGNGAQTEEEPASGHAEAGPHPNAVPLGLLPQPAGLTTALRSYQLVGYNWLSYLHEQGLGGCLADDMGLGKTVQTIALLQRLKETGRLGPSLLVAPVVTLPNWEDEIARFSPGLRCKRHAGADRARSIDALLGPPPADPATAGIGGQVAPGGAAEAPAWPADRDGLTPPGRLGEQAPSGPTSPAPDADRPRGEAAWDLILVSYQTLRNDLDLFVQHPWDYAILDEAHYIKNAGSQIFKAIRVLPAAHRLSLTGTPIENSTMELWAQFSFLNPGLLGSRRHFMSEVAAPIEKGGDEAALGTLRDTIQPFILRRRKQDVLADLPPKDEILNWCEMGSDQARLYEETSAYYRDQIAHTLDSKGVEGSQMDIFRALLRLRQIAINPAMVRHAPRDVYGDPDEDFSGTSPYAHVSSAKMDSLRMIMDESLQEDHKMLVFSQFVTALKLISTDLDRDGRRHALLTGQTADRRTVVKDFQSDEDLKIFLLSLKAGGVGINLTAADYVVLFDPWWNPAAERQAVDRAHRMGQKRPVIVYKFITRGTIEEKILALQHKKHKLVGSLLVGDGEDSLLAGLDEDAVMDLFK
jgi:SNF2 family DNA or RNA helicase